MAASEQALAKIGQQALQLVKANSVVGLGTGKAASAFIRALGEQVRAGFKVRGVATSQASTELAREYGIPLVSLDDVETIDVVVDGADEVDPQGNLIKGYGGALLREKIVASIARQLVILVGDEKLVNSIGQRGRLPVEVVPFGLVTVRRRLQTLGFVAEPRLVAGRLFLTDNGNNILDCRIAPTPDLHALEHSIKAIPGVIETGLFLNMHPQVLVAH